MYVYSCAIYLTVQVCMCNSIRIVNLYPYEKKHYQVFCFYILLLYFTVGLANSIHFQSYLSQGILVRWFHTFVI